MKKKTSPQPSPSSLGKKLSESKKQKSPTQKQKQKSTKQVTKQQKSQASQQLSQSNDNISQTSLTPSLELNHQKKMLQQAIQKASCLIQLLTRQNSQTKNMLDDASDQIKKLKQKNQQLQIKNQQILERLLTKQEQLEITNKENEELLFELEKSKLHVHDLTTNTQKYQQNKENNKKLHERLAVLSSKLIQTQKQLKTIKNQYKSLQNQNEYLIKQLKKSQEKQNTFNQNIERHEIRLKDKIKNIDLTKQAFARRTQELKQENLMILLEVQELRKQKYDLELLNRQSMKTLDLLAQKLDSYKYIDMKINKTYQKIKLITQNPHQQKQLYPASKTHLLQKYCPSLKQKIQQIQLFISYRFQHIQNLINSICENINKKDWKTNLRYLGETQFVVQRLLNYLNELPNANVFKTVA